MRAPDGIATRVVVVDTAFYLALMVLGAVALWPIYQSSAFIVLAAVTIPVGCAIAVLGAVFRWPSPVVLGAAIAGYFLLGVQLAVPGSSLFGGFAPSLVGLQQLTSATALSWKQLLTVDLPVGGYQALLVPAFILLLGGSVLGLSLVLRMRRGSVGILAPVAVMVAAIVLGSQDAGAALPVGLAFLVVALFWMMWRARRRRRAAVALLNDQALAAEGPGTRRVRTASRTSAVRPALVAVLVLALAVSAGTAGAAYLAPANAREVLRSAVERPFDPRDYASPLSGFRRYWQAPEADEGLFTVSGAPKGSRIRLATLDSYDGIVYSVGSDAVSSASGSFSRVPSSVSQDAPGGTDATVHIGILGYSGVWLPTVGDLESISFDGGRARQLGDAFYFNKNSSTAAVLGGVKQGDAYTIRSVVPVVPSDAQLAAAKPGSDTVPTPQNVPDQIEAFVTDATAGIDDPGKRLLAVVAAMRSAGYVSHGVGETEPFSRSGHSADRIAQLFTDSPMLGDGEQYATAVALMADSLGFPARVVLGFAPRADGGPITGSDVQAWVEVDVEGSGWVPLDVTPDIRPVPDKTPDETTQASKPQVVVPPPPAADDESLEPHRPDAAEENQDKPDTSWALLIGILQVSGISLLAVAIVLSPFLAVIGAKLVRRRKRKRAPTGAKRISGAWEDVVDTAVDYGYEIPAGATRTEVAELVEKDPVLVLAKTADEVSFGHGATSESAADEYWRRFDELRANWSLDYTRWERVKAALALTSLRGRARRRPAPTGRPAPTAREKK